MSKEEAAAESPAAAPPVAEAPAATSPAAASPVATSPKATSPTVASPLASTPASPSPGVTAGVPLAAAGDPKVAELQSMFPTVDVGVIEMVLESVSGSQDRAIESLLQMTDPDFKPEETPAAGPENDSQLDLDAEFARALAMQDQEDERESRRQTRGQQQQLPPGQLPYQPRVRRARPAPPQEGQAVTRDLPEQGDQMAAFEDRAAQFVESGRQTFNSIFNRVKTKVNEYQAQSAQNAELRAQQHQQQAQQFDEADEGLWGDRPSAQQGYDTRLTPARSASTTSSQLSSQDGTPTRAARWNPSDTYDDPVPRTGRRSPSNVADKPPVGKIDMAKLGFLPKKRVDLMSSQQDKDPNPTLPGSGPSSPTATTPTTASRSLVAQIPKTPPAETSHHTLGDSDDDDDLEYTRNPFDEK